MGAGHGAGVGPFHFSLTRWSPGVETRSGCECARESSTAELVGEAALLGLS